MKVEIDISEERIKGLLCNAFEGGSNYWYMIEEYRFPPDIKYEDFKEGGKFQDPNDYWHPAQLIPLVKGCKVIICDTDSSKERTYILEREGIQSGLQIMAQKYPQHFKAVLDETDDATTGDVFLQCCLFGEAIYG